MVEFDIAQRGRAPAEKKEEQMCPTLLPCPPVCPMHDTTVREQPPTEPPEGASTTGAHRACGGRAPQPSTGTVGKVKGLGGTGGGPLTARQLAQN